jgi:hypothetical protein
MIHGYNGFGIVEQEIAEFTVYSALQNPKENRQGSKEVNPLNPPLFYFLFLL